MPITVQKSREFESLKMLQVKPSRKLPALVDDARTGLLSRPRSLPPKYFYDDIGSQLFEQICQTSEYYPTRTEDQLLAAHAKTIIQHSLPDRIIEFGSGNSRKTCRLFDACETVGHHCDYTPFDVCEPVLEQAAAELHENYTWLNVLPLLGDYHAGLDNLPDFDGSRLFVFLGGSIGNFTRPEARNFILEIHDCMKPGDYFLLGADRVKDPGILQAAYNDNAGITALFNLNVLDVLNRELGADFVTANFVHEAGYNDGLQRIEMYLLSTVDQDVILPVFEETVHLEEGERILTELSHKFRYEELEDMLIKAGFVITDHFQPVNKFYSLILAGYNANPG